MKALCVDENRNLQLRDIAPPPAPAAGYVTVKIAGAAINHGDKTFLKMPGAAGRALGARLEDVYGASASGVVTEIGEGVPSYYLGSKVAIYRGLQSDLAVLGTWCEIAQVPYLTCLPLPEHLDPRDYSGSLVNVVTAYSFIEQVTSEGHDGIVVTAGGSATGNAMTALARRRNLPVLSIARNAASREEILRSGAKHVLASDTPDVLHDFELLARELNATAVFDGVGGDLVSQLIGVLPPRSSIFFYGFLSGAEKVSFHSAVLMMKDTTMRRFSNFESPTIRDDKRLAAMLCDLEDCIEDPLFRTRIGKDFALSDFEAAMGYHAPGGLKANFSLSI